MTTTTQETPIKSLLEEVIKTYTFTHIPQVTQSTSNPEKYSGRIHVDCELELWRSETRKNAKIPKYDLRISIHDVENGARNACLPDEEYVRLPKTPFSNYTTFNNEHETTQIQYHKKTAEEIRTILKTTIPIIQELAPILRKANWGIAVARQHDYKFQEY